MERALPIGDAQHKRESTAAPLDWTIVTLRRCQTFSLPVHMKVCSLFCGMGCLILRCTSAENSSLIQAVPKTVENHWTSDLSVFARVFLHSECEHQGSRGSSAPCRGRPSHFAVARTLLDKDGRSCQWVIHFLTDCRVLQSGWCSL